MTAHLMLVIPGAMRGKQRPRATRRGTVYTPQQTVNAEAFVKACAFEQIGQPMLQTPLNVSIDIDVEVPASWSKKRRADALSGDTRPIGKPDLDNCCKLLMDALNGIAWRDDSQVVRLTARKRYAVTAQTVVNIAEALP